MEASRFDDLVKTLGVKSGSRRSLLKKTFAAAAPAIIGMASATGGNAKRKKHHHKKPQCGPDCLKRTQCTAAGCFTEFRVCENGLCVTDLALCVAGAPPGFTVICGPECFAGGCDLPRDSPCYCSSPNHRGLTTCNGGTPTCECFTDCGSEYCPTIPQDCPAELPNKCVDADGCLANCIAACDSGTIFDATACACVA